MRALPLLAAAVLGVGSAFLVSCGDRSGLIPPTDAQRLDAALDGVASAVQARDCDAAQRELTRARGALGQLPDSVDGRLRARLQDGIDHLAEQAPTACAQQPAQTGAATTQTQTQETTQTETDTQTDTEPTQTETTQTDTQPPQTQTDTQPPTMGTDGGTGGAPPQEEQP